MKRKIITITLIAITSITNLLFAQDVTAAGPVKAGYDQKKNVKARVSQTDGKVMGADDWEAPNAKVAQGQHIKKGLLTCRVTPTDNGCVITMENSVKSPRDAASGLPTGKRMHKPMSFLVSSSDNSVTEVKSPRDVATGQSTGKRQHKPIRIPKEYNASTPKLAGIAVSSSDSPPSEISIDEPGVHKVAMQDFHFSITCGGKTTEISCVDGVCEIPLDRCPNGACSAIASWSWGASNSGSMSSGSGMTGLSRCSVSFSLEIEGGECTAMAINEKGLPGDKKPNTSTTNNPK
jgi:hypothetical protein